MITSIIEILEAQIFGQMNASAIYVMKIYW